MTRCSPFASPTQIPVLVGESDGRRQRYAGSISATSRSRPACAGAWRVRDEEVGVCPTGLQRSRGRCRREPSRSACAASSAGRRSISPKSGVRRPDASAMPTALNSSFSRAPVGVAHRREDVASRRQLLEALDRSRADGRAVQTRSRQPRARGGRGFAPEADCGPSRATATTVVASGRQCRHDETRDDAAHDPAAQDPAFDPHGA